MITIITAFVICGNLMFEFDEHRYLTDTEIEEFPASCWVKYNHEYVDVIIPRLRPSEGEN